LGKERDALRLKALMVEEENVKLQTEIKRLIDASDKESAKLSELETNIRELKLALETGAMANESEQKRF